MEEEDNTPKHRLEHSVSSSATCRQAACQRAKAKIAKGELRLGTYVLFEGEGKMIWEWRHWRCATPQQIKGLKEIANGKPDDAPGFTNLSRESQPEVAKAFEAESIVDKDFVDIREDLVLSYNGSPRRVVGYRVEIATSGRAACRDQSCWAAKKKIGKGELRFASLVDFDGEHSSLHYKHWACVTPEDLQNWKSYRQGALDDDYDLHGLDQLPPQHRAVVEGSLKAGKALDAPPPEKPAPKPKARKPKKKRTSEEMDTDGEEHSEPKNKRKKKAKAQKKARDSKSDDSGEEMEMPKPRRKRVVEKPNPEEENIVLMTQQMRERALSVPSK